MDDTALTRRDALKLGALSAAALTIPSLPGPLAANRASELAQNRIPRPYAMPFRKPPVLHPAGRIGNRDVYEITQSQVRREILPGIKTTLFAYNGTVPGPTIRVQRNRPILVRQKNELPARHPRLGYVPWTSTHLHGAASQPQFDGYASDVSLPGQYKDYLYDNTEAGRTLWYHDHGVHHTTENVYMGLAGQYHVLDGLENALGLPRGQYDVPLMISDVAFTAAGELLFDNHSDSGLMGDVILVNGVPWPLMGVEPRKYRFRLLVATNARSFRLRMSNGAPMTVVATDGGLAPRPIPVTEMLVGMAERYDLVVDFAPYKGQRIELLNADVDNTIEYDHTNKVMAFQVGQTVSDPTNNTIPAALLDSPVMALDPRDAVRTRRMRFERQGSEWVVDGHTWDDVIRSEYRKTIAEPEVGDVEVWEFENNSGGWFHPIHVHLTDFKVLDRNGRPPRAHEAGPKDTVYVGEGEVVRIIAEFGSVVTPSPDVPEIRREGRYMIHCHNVTHEDHDMMTQFWVGGQGAGPDPITAAPPQPLPAPPIPPLV